MYRIFRPQVKEYLFHRFVQNNCNIGFTYNKNGSNNPSNILYRTIKHIDTVKNNDFNMVYTDRMDVAAKCAISYVKNQDNPGLIFANPSPSPSLNMEDNVSRDYVKLVKSCIESLSSCNPLIVVNLFYKNQDDTLDMLLNGMIKDNIKINSSDGVESTLDFLFNDAILKYQSGDKQGFRYESNNIFSLSVNHEILYERMDIEVIDNVGIDNVGIDMLDEAESELQYLERLYRTVEKDER